MLSKHGCSTLLSLMLVASAGAYADVTQPDPAAHTYPLINNFRNTWYYSVREADYAGQSDNTPILDMDDKVLVKVPAAFKRAVDIEGSGKLTDGRVINFAGIKDKQIRYHFTIHPFGRGVGNCVLDPYHTIAVDPQEIPLGTLVSIDETVGMVLPDGTKHDGLWKAEDIGGAIRKDRIDLFLGEGFNGYVLDKAGIKNLQALHVRLVAQPAAKNCTTEDPQ